ncbi:MAG TPA: AmmeMemoRadiSam system protein B [Ilumatobacter sp.]|nr:AmmeMemoRadiSam system protein B [Ilumatobacter sp.]
MMHGRRTRSPAVAGLFYPADPDELRALLRSCFADAVTPGPSATAPSALVVPHAGLVYSGPIAASAYLRLAALRTGVRRVVLLGPSHRVPMRGIGLTSATDWQSPLGPVTIDHRADDALLALSFVVVRDDAHAPEHSLEVQLPFLQVVLDEFELLPMVVGAADAQQVATAIDTVWTSPDTLVLVSTDLSHYHRYAEAVQLDTRTAAAIVAKHDGDIADLDACGARPLRGLLRTAAERDLEVEQLDLRNSGDTAGDRDRVVGYGAFALA